MNSIKLFFSFLFLLSSLFWRGGANEVFSQTFHKRYGDGIFPTGGFGSEEGHAVKQTADGGYIITGYTQSYSAAGDIDAYVLKTNINGDTLWTKTYGSLITTDDESGNDVQQTGDGGYIIVGVADSCCTGGGFQTNIFLIKTTFTGDTLWTKTFSGPGVPDNDIGTSIQQTLDGGYIITGWTISFGGTEAVTLLKTDSNGNITWSKIYEGTSAEMGNHVLQTSDSGYIVTGITTSFGAGNKDVFVMKTDNNGNQLWYKTYGGANDETGFFIQQTTDGGFIISGLTNTFGVNDSYLLKIDANGNLIWSKNYVGSGPARSIQQTIDGGFVFISSGGSNTNIEVIKTDSTGNVLWAKIFGDAVFNNHLYYGYSIQQTFDEGFILAGHLFDMLSNTSDIVLIKTDSLGNSNCPAEELNLNITSGNPSTVVINATPTQTTVTYLVSNPSRRMSNGTIIDTLCYSPIGFGENFNIETHIYPNPSNGKFKTDILGKVSIYNILGEKIFSQKLISKKIEIDLSQHPKGIYFIRMQSDAKIYAGKIVIQ